MQRIASKRSSTIKIDDFTVERTKTGGVAGGSTYGRNEDLLDIPMEDIDAFCEIGS